jgi:protein TonB
VHAERDSEVESRVPSPTAGHPFDRVFELGPSDRRRVLSLALAAALVAHGGMAGAIRLRGEELTEELPLLTQELSIEREVPAPPPTPEPPPPPPAPPEPPRAAANVIAPAQSPSDNPYDQPASEAAQAGQVLVQDTDQEEKDDPAEENTFVTGDAGTYAGGMTASTGTSTLAVRGSLAGAGGVVGGIGTRVQAPKPTPHDLSRGAWLEGTTSWDCDFPGEAERDHIRDAVVEMTVNVRPNGTAQRVTILDDPGHGFGRVAAACALRHRFTPALDPEGHPIWGKTRPFHVGFHR